MPPIPAITPPRGELLTLVVTLAVAFSPGAALATSSPRAAAAGAPGAAPAVVPIDVGAGSYRRRCGRIPAESVSLRDWSKAQARGTWGAVPCEKHGRRISLRGDWRLTRQKRLERRAVMRLSERLSSYDAVAKQHLHARGWRLRALASR